MNVDHTLAQFSDSAFFTAFMIYFFALALSIVFYMKRQGMIDLEREQSASETFSEEQAAALTRMEAAANKFAGMTHMMVWLGIIIHIASLVLRGVAAQRFPFGNLYEYISTITMSTMIAAAFYFQKKELRVMWPWLLVPVLSLLFFGGTKLYAATAPVVPALQSYWLKVHVSIVAGGASIGMISGIVSIVYLLRVWQPVGGEHGFFAPLLKPLPSAKFLDTVAYRTAIITVPVFGLGIVLGAIWAEQTWGRFWGWDPKETFALITWMLYAAYLHARATAGWRDSRAAWINILALGTMIFNLFFINLVVSGLHSYAGLN